MAVSVVDDLSNMPMAESVFKTQPQTPSIKMGNYSIPATNAPPYSAFSVRSKYYIIYMVAIPSCFSALSANIYFPALNSLSRDLKVSSTLINLSLTTYMIFQALAPTIFGDFSDTAGRRPPYIIGFSIYIGANIGLALQNNYVALLILRCLQSTGSSSAVALGSGVVADISTSAERGKYMGILQAGTMAGPTLGPVIGGLLAQYLGWRSIFLFLTITASIWFITFLISFPECGRNVVGNGSVEAEGWNRSLLDLLTHRRHGTPNSAPELQPGPGNLKPRTLRWPNPLKTIRILMEKDIAVVLFFNSIVYAAFYDVAASTPSLFADIYGFNDLQIGLCYLPVGVGSILASIISGRLMDWNYKRVAIQAGLTVDHRRGDDLRNFPIEKTRIQLIWPVVFIGFTSILCYGWVLQQKAPLAVPLVLQFIMGVCLNTPFSILATLAVDLYPKAPATVTAANNIMRCLMGAGATAVISLMIEKMGIGWCFTFIGLVGLLSTPLLWVETHWGPAWREERRVRFQLQEVEASGL